ncbi:MAG: site-specific DNA-methyltransferase [Rhodospirillales bacterium]|nr:site-specific DNA-methyltransferase [Alphaproteobacteria bacterium]MCB9987647.1 site-specific DNA-methyltransferase [Rhodospirillales bacterium]USO08054.1 MAG: site-specific DNA-methyltransferase [Rhodospirillales bacterium]
MTESLIQIPFRLERPTPPFEGDEIRYPEALVRHFLKKYTKPGDRVFDPFTGLGTTLFVAEEMKRIPFGVEADVKRFEWVAGQLEHWQNLVPGDAAKLARYGLPKMDFCMTSPPYMPRHHRWNPLFAGNPRHAGYDVYLRRMALIFGNIAPLMKKNAALVVQADNLHHGKRFTPLVRDIAACVARGFDQEDEIIVRWSPAKQGYPHTHCLIFRKK